VQAILAQPFDRHDFRAGHVAHRGNAGSNRLSILVDGTSATKRYAATELGAGQLQLVTQIPEQWHFGIAIKCMLNSINFDLDHLLVSLYPSAVLKKFFSRKAR
jgi:hypothetical protein